MPYTSRLAVSSVTKNGARWDGHIVFYTTGCIAPLSGHPKESDDGLLMHALHMRCTVFMCNINIPCAVVYAKRCWTNEGMGSQCISNINVLSTTHNVAVSVSSLVYPPHCYNLAVKRVVVLSLTRPQVSGEYALPYFDMTWPRCRPLLRLSCFPNARPSSSYFIFRAIHNNRVPNPGLFRNIYIYIIYVQTRRWIWIIYSTLKHRTQLIYTATYT